MAPLQITPRIFLFIDSNCCQTKGMLLVLRSDYKEAKVSHFRVHPEVRLARPNLINTIYLRAFSRTVLSFRYRVTKLATVNLSKGYEARMEVSLSCTELVNLDIWSKSDPMCVLSVKKSGKWVELGRTETIYDDLTPQVLQWDGKRQSGGVTNHLVLM